MTSKKQLKAEIVALQKQLNDLITNLQNGTGPVDSEADFAETTVITKRNFIESVKNASMAEKSADDTITTDINEGSQDQLLQFGNHKMIQDESFFMLYGGEINRFVDNGIAECSVYNEDEEIGDVAVKAFRYAFLFSSIAVDKEKNLYILVKREGDTYYGRQVEDMENAYTAPEIVMSMVNQYTDKKAPQKGSKTQTGGDSNNDTSLLALKKENIAILKFGWDDIGAYIKAIQYLAPYIYYRRIREKNSGFCQVVADTSFLGRKKPWWITMFNCFRIRDKSTDNQMQKQMDSQRQAATSSLIKGYAPEETEKTYNIISNMIDQQWRLFCSQFGIEVQAADEKQTLSQEADVASHYTLNIKKNILGKYYRFLDKLHNLFGESGDFQFIDDEQASPQEMGYGAPEGNDNASGGDMEIKSNKTIKKGGKYGG